MLGIKKLRHEMERTPQIDEICDLHIRREYKRMGFKVPHARHLKNRYPYEMFCEGFDRGFEIGRLISQNLYDINDKNDEGDKEC